MGPHQSKHKVVELALIDLTGTTNKYKEKIENLLDDIELHLVRQIDGSHPWLVICNAKIHGIEIDVTATIPERLPNTDQPGMVIMVTTKEVYDYKASYPDTRIKYITCVDPEFNNTYRLNKSLPAFIAKDWLQIDRNEYALKDELSVAIDRNTSGQRKENISVGRPLDKHETIYMVEQSLLKFLQANFPDLPLLSIKPVHDNSRQESEFYHFLINSTIGESMRCVVLNVEEMNSNTIKVCRNQDVGAQVHIIVEEKGIDDTLVINNLAQKGIKTFLHQILTDEVDVILDGSTTMNAYLESFLIAAKHDVKVNLLPAKKNPTHPWIFVCEIFNEQKILKLKETVKDYESMVIRVHGRERIPLEAKIRNIAKEDNKPTVYLILGSSGIDDSSYMNKSAKEELNNVLESNLIGNVAGDNMNKGKLESKGISSQHRKRVYIKYIANLPKRAFANFIERYIARIEPIWMTGEDPIEEGSLCIVVCFNLSRLRDDIDAVLQGTPQECTKMLVVIQNCREGMPPQPMLKRNPSDNLVDFTNILYDDGECYYCDINYLAREKVQAFIDNN